MSHTPGPWHVGHFADDSHSCNCTGIGSECYLGSVAQITIGNGLPIADGGNDCPPLEEAKANGRLIAAAPDLLVALKKCIEVFQMLADAGNYPLPLYQNGGWKFAADAIVKAEGRAAEGDPSLGQPEATLLKVQPPYIELLEFEPCKIVESWKIKKATPRVE